MNIRDSIVEYVRDMVQLALTLELNDQDEEFTRGKSDSDTKGESDSSIIYFFDADIVGLFLSPFSLSRYVSLFSDADGESGYEASRSLTALITAEFLFSARLPGQKIPPQTTFCHTLDVHSMVRAISEKFDIELKRYDPSSDPIIRDLIDEEDVEDFGNITKDLMDLVRAERLADDEHLYDILQKSRDMIRDIYGDSNNGVVVEAANLQRLRKKDFGVSFAGNTYDETHLAKSYNAIYKSPDTEAINEWTGRIAAALVRDDYRGIDHGKECLAKINNSRHNNIKRDAQSIVEVQKLNDRYGSSNLKYVLVSGAKSLHRAYNYWYSNREAGRPVHYILRSPLQYVPMLNLANMASVRAINFDFERYRSFYREICNSVKYLMFASDNSPVYRLDPLRIFTDLLVTLEGEEWVALKRMAHNADWLDMKQELGQAKKTWRELVIYSLVSNLDLAKTRNEETQNKLNSNARQFRDNLLEYQTHIADRLGSRHMIFELAKRTETFVELSAKLKKQGSSFHRNRSPLIIFSRFQNYTEGKSLIEYLDNELFSDDPHAAVIKKINGELDRSGSTNDEDVRTRLEAILLCGCVAARTSNWELAKMCAERFLDDFELHGKVRFDESFKSDALYLQALSLRFVGENEANINHAQESLELSKVSKSNTNVFDLLLQARADAECATLLICACYGSYVDSELDTSTQVLGGARGLKISPDKLSQYTKDVNQLLNAVNAAIAELETRPSDFGDQVQRIRFSTLINSICFANFLHVTGQSVKEYECVKDISGLISEVKAHKKTKGRLPLIAKADFQFGKLIFGTKKKERRDAREKLEKILAEREQFFSQNQGEDFTRQVVPPADEYVLATISNYLTANAVEDTS